MPNFNLFTTNIVTGIMLGFVAVVIGRIVALEVNKLKLGTIIIAIALFLFYALGYAI